ncbi:hypothetical protein [Burkholderia cepacia]|uniref:hypothetical protein n=1 Tax=Burkholderia cepacia TaxID=292 RepID=UPI001782717C|nr:hypothetical protein [Burkholderia cepacia]QOH38550.1 hypothetical protein C7S14_1534 [Burkholderia cepacia]
MAPRLSNLKVSRLDLRPDVVEKSGFVAILPAFCPLPACFLPASGVFSGPVGEGNRDTPPFAPEFSFPPQRRRTM